MSGEPEIRLVSQRLNADGSTAYVERWACDPPDIDLRYEVLREAWNEDDSVRTIYEIKVVSA